MKPTLKTVVTGTLVVLAIVGALVTWRVVRTRRLARQAEPLVLAVIGPRSGPGAFPGCARASASPRC
jgi:hypothetical protein